MCHMLYSPRFIEISERSLHFITYARLIYLINRYYVQTSVFHPLVYFRPLGSSTDLIFTNR